ncbi:bacillithiol biosynthesis deacetylase BshB1 [Pedobacter jamesrossensis]|uniref:Bacillithiol biosynthesis deacetylase BshB1 n=1 Tax=Pedobacter jamesrossensis TaxID=1908238 RepID=A0ABV8NM28_9SPHI
MKVDILAFGAHPDDVECAAGGVLISSILDGGKVVVVDLTRGEMGTFGDTETRQQEALLAAEHMGLFARRNLDLGDGRIENSFSNRLKVIQIIREYKPKIILANAISDRHPDHKNAAELVSQASFLSGLKKLSDVANEEYLQEPWRPSAVYHYIQDYFLKPDVVIDISSVFEKKMETIKLFRSQFLTADDHQANGILALMGQIEATNKIFGRAINVNYAEGFTSERYIGAKNFSSII